MQKLSHRIFTTKILPNRWDIPPLIILISIIIVSIWVISHLGGDVNYSNMESLESYKTISMQLSNLPRYAADTTVRIFIALICSLTFSLFTGFWAAKSKKAERIIIPIIDVLQSVPILGFLTIVVSGFLKISPYSLWGAQLAIIFGLFTAQAWNIMLSFYQSLKMIPQELTEVSKICQLSIWQRFWKLEVPFAIPSLIWNTMMSMSASWFIIVASEVIVVNFSSKSSAMIKLPGIGSFINQANNNQDLIAVLSAIFTMLLIIILYDQIIFRPIIAWSEKFVMTDQRQEIEYKSWLLKVLQKASIVKALNQCIKAKANRLLHLEYFNKPDKNKEHKTYAKQNTTNNKKLIWKIVIVSIAYIIICIIGQTYKHKVNFINLYEIIRVCGYGLATFTRVCVLIIISSIIWLPIGIWIGLKPKITTKIQIYAQLLAAFPVNVLYGLFGTIVIRYDLNFELWCTLLMALGTNWYILFNVVAGASTIPSDLKMAANSMQLKGKTRWLKFLLPAVMPFYVTGAITAAGGAWNASIICEYINWGNNSVITATGIGSYISQQYQSQGNHTIHILSGVIIMCIFVMITNKLFWNKIYYYVEKKFSIDE